MKKLSLLLTLFCVFPLSLCQLGPNGQDCTPDDDIPEVCTATSAPWDYISARNKVECESNFDCCLCESITCTQCEAFSANGDLSAYFVQDIVVRGSRDDGASIECGGDSSCEGTQLRGRNIKQVKCGGDRSCFAAEWDIVCRASEQCKFECDGDSGCQEATMSAENVASLSCKGDKACSRATITITNPNEDFKLECGDGGCQDLVLTIIINDNINGLEEISCGASNGCNGAVIEIINNGANTLKIETLDCEAFAACKDAQFILTGDVIIEECKCSDEYGCFGATINTADCLIDTSVTVVGPEGQNCVWYPDNGAPQVCTSQSEPWHSIKSRDKIECDRASDCCLCESITCRNCDEFKASGDFAAFMNTEISIAGTAEDAASIDCGGYSSCEGTVLSGSYIKEAQCNAYRACYGILWDIACSAEDLCGIECDEESACEQATITATNVKHFKCDGNRACLGGEFAFSCDENEECEIECDGDQSCLGAVIDVSNVDGLKCNGLLACFNATIIITEPSSDFEVECGEFGCQGLNLFIIVNEVTQLKEINCAAEYGCNAATIVITNNGADTLNIGKVDCEQGAACRDAVFVLNGDIVVEECLCGEIGEGEYGCDGAIGLPCFSAVSALAEGEMSPIDIAKNNDIETEYRLSLSFSTMVLENLWGIVCVVMAINILLFCWFYARCSTAKNATFVSSEKRV